MTSETKTTTVLEKFPIESSPSLQLWVRELPSRAYGVVSETQWRYTHAIRSDSALVGAITTSGIDVVHGTRSGALSSIIARGIIPQAHQAEQGISPITGEYHSLAAPREYVHVVPWLYAEGTLDYADNAENSNKDNLTLDNYQPTLKFGAGILKTINPGLALHTHYEQKLHAAQRFAKWWESDQPTEIERELHQRDFPVLLGVRLGQDSQTRLRTYDTYIRFDTGIKGSVSSEQIPLLWVPNEQMAFTKQLVGDQRAEVLSLEQLRSTLYNPYGPQ